MKIVITKIIRIIVIIIRIKNQDELKINLMILLKMISMIKIKIKVNQIIKLLIQTNYRKTSNKYKEYIKIKQIKRMLNNY